MLHASSFDPAGVRPTEQTEPAVRGPTLYCRLKRLVEPLIGVALLVALFPILVVLWLAVRVTSPGPGIYRQRRTGRQGREFSIYKLRTMAHNCERGTGAVWARPNDVRVTRLGRLLRRMHLDELPQLVNVALGQMSLVGPRPERPEIITQIVPEVPEYPVRLEVAPGVTGLAQIFAGADQTIDDVRRKLHYDLEYIATASLWLDLRIVVCTALKVVGLNRLWVRMLLFPDVEVHGLRKLAPAASEAPWAAALAVGGFRDYVPNMEATARSTGTNGKPPAQSNGALHPSPAELPAAGG